MELLIIILMKMGFYYTPDLLNTPVASQSQEVKNAKYIIDEGLYHFEEDGGVVIEDDVDPVH
ncbi:hypothetical protein BH11BAC1_BH11BAC1_11110 [soil metagenome]